jgi:uncharacterized membrane-anchored protein YjiN (DUF445 family)
VTTTSARTEAPRTNEQRPAGQERDGSDSPHLDRGLESRARAFVAARRRATALLFVVAVVFVVVTVVGAKGTLLGYVQAGAEAAMIGGIADWFAVTALFRRPLGLPIPHTALIVERKDQFAATLGQFFQENFLNAEVLAGHIRSADLPKRLASWMSDRDNASRFSDRAADLVVEMANLLRDEDMERVLATELSRVLEGVDASELLRRGLLVLIAGDGHNELFDAAVTAADRYLEEHHDELRDRFVKETPNWVPDSLDRMIFERINGRLRRWLASVVANQQDETRLQFDEWVKGLSDRLQSDPELRRQVEKVKHDFLSRAEVREWSASLWQHGKENLRAQAADPNSQLRTQLASVIVSAGERLASDPSLQASLERFVVSGVGALADQFQSEVSGLVSATVSRWNPETTAHRLELLLGRDLQFIRINGTVVGAAIGLALHALAGALA